MKRSREASYFFSSDNSFFMLDMYGDSPMATGRFHLHLQTDDGSKCKTFRLECTRNHETAMDSAPRDSRRKV